jgi:PPM family protein phosphatase
VLTREFEGSAGGAMLISLLPRLVQHANAAVHDRTLAPQFRGKKMATTVVACALRHDQAIVSHVGDSRCYLVRNGLAKQITHDHSWVNEQRKMGVISAVDVAQSEMRHVLTRSLGPEMFVSPDTIALSIQPRDVLVLCSDGVHDKMPESTIATIVSQSKPVDEIAEELVSRAVDNDGHDNTTAIVIRIRSVEQIGMYRGRPYHLHS